MGRPYRARDASKLSKAILERGVQAEAMTLTDYRRSLEEGERRAPFISWRQFSADASAGRDRTVEGRPQMTPRRKEALRIVFSIAVTALVVAGTITVFLYLERVYR